jgi:predicted dehydrogenase
VTYKILNVAVLGTGAWAQSVHIPVLQSFSGKLRLLAICGSDEIHTREVASKFSIPRYSTSIEETLDDRAIDLVSIVSSTDLHYEIAHRAIRFGKAIICEKPLATSVTKARRLVHLAEIAGIKTKVNFGFRYSRALVKMKSMLRTGSLGEILHVNAFEQNSKYMDGEHPLHFPKRKISSDILAPGSLQEYAPHIIDLALFTAGKIESVSGHMARLIQNSKVVEKAAPDPVENGSVWLLHFAGGAIGTMQSSFVTIGQTPGLEFRLYGSKGALVGRIPGEDGSPESLTYATRDRPKFVPVPLPENEGTLTPSQERFRLLVREFVREISENDRRPQCTFQDGLRVQEVIEAIQLSHRRRRWVDVRS